MPDRNGKRKTREQLSKRRVPELGYYFIVTDTKIVNLPECSVAIHSSSQGRVPLGDLGSV